MPFTAHNYLSSTSHTCSILWCLYSMCDMYVTGTVPGDKIDACVSVYIVKAVKVRYGLLIARTVFLLFLFVLSQLAISYSF